MNGDKFGFKDCSRLILKVNGRRQCIGLKKTHKEIPRLLSNLYPSYINLHVQGVRETKIELKDGSIEVYIQ